MTCCRHHILGWGAWYMYMSIQHSTVCQEFDVIGTYLVCGLTTMAGDRSVCLWHDLVVSGPHSHGWCVGLGGQAYVVSPPWLGRLSLPVTWLCGLRTLTLEFRMTGTDLCGITTMAVRLSLPVTWLCGLRTLTLEFGMTWTWLWSEYTDLGVWRRHDYIMVV